MTSVTEHESGPPYRLIWDYQVEDIIDGQQLLEPRLGFLTFNAAVLMIVAAYLLETVGEIQALIPAVVAVAFFVLDFSWIIRRRGARSALGQHEGEHVTMIIDESGVTWSRPGATYRHDWSSLTGLRQNERMTMLMEGGYAQLWCPSRAFESPDARWRITSYIEGQIAKAAIAKQVNNPSLPPPDDRGRFSSV